MRFVLVLCLTLVGAATAYAGLFSDVVDAVKGHVEDVKDRVSHEDQFIDGMVISRSEFRRDDLGRDRIHWADGTVSLVVGSDSRHIQFESDFVTGPAPDLYLYIASQKVYDEESFWAAEPTEIAKLQSGSGAQHYAIEAEGHVEVIIWCKRFGEFIGAATL